MQIKIVLLCRDIGEDAKDGTLVKNFSETSITDSVTGKTINIM